MNLAGQREFNHIDYLTQNRSKIMSINAKDKIERG